MIRRTALISALVLSLFVLTGLNTYPASAMDIGGMDMSSMDMGSMDMEGMDMSSMPGMDMLGDIPGMDMVSELLGGAMDPSGSISSIMSVVGDLVGQIMEVGEGLMGSMMGGMGGCGPFGDGFEMIGMVSDTISGAAEDFLGEGNMVSEIADTVGNTATDIGENLDSGDISGATQSATDGASGLFDTIRNQAGTQSSQSEDAGH